jgi:hypothetical protein
VETNCGPIGKLKVFLRNWSRSILKWWNLNQEWKNLPYPFNLVSIVSKKLTCYRTRRPSLRRQNDVFIAGPVTNVTLA